MSEEVEIKLEKVGETADQLVLKDPATGTCIRVPKDPEKIPEKSCMIGTKDVTADVVKAVKALVKEEG
jgi:hypothetical protein